MAIIKELKYISSVVTIGSLPLGGTNPVRLQSMTNTDTLDTRSSVMQCIRIIEAGADIVRLTTQGIREAENLALIKNELRKAGYNTPLVADVHFNPAVAELAASIADKVRINPGNYTDKRASFQRIDLTDTEYDEELERIHSRILPLLNICRSNGTALRIGVNHGSLSDRIMTRYGNTSAGMVASAIEFIRILKAENFTSLVLSMKSSDTDIMIDATRLLVKSMQDEGVSYPLHLGVTEAGEGEDGRVRSAAGIGTLLSEGIGDTIRVSLSEDPEKEIPVARKLIQFLPGRIAEKSRGETISFPEFREKPAHFKAVTGPLIMADFTAYRDFTSDNYSGAGFIVDKSGGSITRSDGSADIIFASDCPSSIPATVNIAVPFRLWLKNRQAENLSPLFSPGSYSEITERSEQMNYIFADTDSPVEMYSSISADNTMLLLRCEPDRDMFAADTFVYSLFKVNSRLNVILNPQFNESDTETLIIKAAAFTGRFLNSKSIAGICITNRGKINQSLITKLSFSVLQCTGVRITRTQYISCPTCGRTKFNLPDAVRKVKEATGHLKGLKIAVMGCIVNGPGEMAGSDWGYVGAGNGKVHIYKGQDVVLKNIPEKEAVAKFLELIESDLTNC